MHRAGSSSFRMARNQSPQYLWVDSEASPTYTQAMEVYSSVHCVCLAVMCCDVCCVLQEAGASCEDPWPHVWPDGGPSSLLLLLCQELSRCWGCVEVFPRHWLPYHLRALSHHCQLHSIVCTTVVYVHVHILCMLIRYRKKEASKVKQTTRQSNTTHSRQSLFFKEKWAASGGTRTHDTLHSRQSALPATEAAQLAGPKSYIVRLIVYVYTHVAVCTCIHTCCSLYVYTHMLQSVYVYTHVAVCIRIHTCCSLYVYTHMLQSVRVYTHVAVCIRIHTCCSLYTYTHMLQSVYVYTHVAVCIRIHTCCSLYTYTHMLQSVNVYTHVAVCIRIHTCCSLYVYTHMLQSVHVYTHVAVCTCIHTCCSL